MGPGTVTATLHRASAPPPSGKVGLSTHPLLPGSPAAPLNAGLCFPTPRPAPHNHLCCLNGLSFNLWKLMETYTLSYSYSDTNSMHHITLFSLPWSSPAKLFGLHCCTSLTQLHHAHSHFSPSRPLQSCTQDSGLCPEPAPGRTAAQLLRKQPFRGHLPSPCHVSGGSSWGLHGTQQLASARPPCSQDQPRRGHEASSKTGGRKQGTNKSSSSVKPRWREQNLSGKQRADL